MALPPPSSRVAAPLSDGGGGGIAFLSQDLHVFCPRAGKEGWRKAKGRCLSKNVIVAAWEHGRYAMKADLLPAAWKYSGYRLLEHRQADIRNHFLHSPFNLIYSMTAMGKLHGRGVDIHSTQEHESGKEKRSLDS